VIVTYFGDHCFRVQSGELSVLVNPSSNRLKGDVVLRTITSAATGAQTQKARPLTPERSDGGREISFPGEYEMKGIVVRGFPFPHESTEKFLKTIYLVQWEDVSLAFLGHISKAFDGELLEELGEPDVLFVPTGDDHFIAPEAAAKLAKQLEPAVIIPSYAKDAKGFLKTFGQSASPQEKFVFKKKDLTGKKGEVVLLSVA